MELIVGAGDKFEDYRLESISSFIYFLNKS